MTSILNLYDKTAKKWVGIPALKGEKGDPVSLLEAYPIGSLYWSTVNSSPATLFGGDWIAIEDVFLLAAGSTYAAGSTGGEAEHTLDINEMPRHNHSAVVGNNDSASSDKYNLTHNTSSSTWAGGYTYINYTGGSQPHNNMPPYLAVYVWKRIA